MKRLGALLLPLDGILVYRRVPLRRLLGLPNSSMASIYLGRDKVESIEFLV